MVLEPGKIYVPASAEEIRDEFLTDIRLEADNQGISAPVQPGTDWHVLGTAAANMALIMYANISIADSNGDVLNSTGDELDAIRIAYGLPEVLESPSSGKVVASVLGGGAITIPDGTEFTFPNGLRGKSSGAFVGITDGADIDVIAIDGGEETNLAAGEVVRWVSPPLNLETEARVSVNGPLTGGTDEETDARKRDRILNRLQNLPAGGNVGFVIETALNSLGSLQYAFVYPALGGPGSMKVALIRDYDESLSDFTRVLGAGAATVVRSALHAEMPSPMEIVVQSAAGEDNDVALTLDIPDAATSGGNGSGWQDDTVWPDLAGGDTRVFVSLVTSTSQIRVNASTAVSPIAGQTHISWWSLTDQRFYTRLVTVVGGGAGAWDLTLDAPLVASDGTIVAIGDFVCPAAVNIDAYAETWRAAMRNLGPGENTADANRLPRALRHPFIADDWPSSLNLRVLRNFVDKHDEINDAAWSYRLLTAPTVPGAVSTAPNFLSSRQFGVYSA